MEQEGDPRHVIGSSESGNKYPDKLDSDPQPATPLPPQSRTDTTRSVKTSGPVFASDH